MRWYRIHSIRNRAVGSLEIDMTDNVVQATGVAEAWDKVMALGWWPVSLVNSAWSQADV